MKIAFLGRWNATCGVSLHAELVGRKLCSMGYGVEVFAPRLISANKDWHHKKVKIRDEEWVHRIYDETTEIDYPYGGSIDDTILMHDYDFLVVELYGRLPILELVRKAEKLKKSSKLVGVVHSAYRRDVEAALKIPWDALVIFDRRYYDELLRGFDLSRVGRIEEIPYPFALIDGVSPVRPKFAEKGVLFFTYGRQPAIEYVDYIRALRELRGECDLTYFVLRSDQKLPVDESWIVQEVDRPTIAKVYEYLMGADVHLLPKGESRGVVISSTVCQCLYSGTPTIVPDTKYFEMIEVDENGIGPVVKYRLGDVKDLMEKIRLLVKVDSVREKVSRRAREYALEHSDEKVAKRFLKLFESL